MDEMTKFCNRCGGEVIPSDATRIVCTCTPSSLDPLPAISAGISEFRELEDLLSKATPGDWFAWFRKPEYEGDSGGYDVSSKAKDCILAEFNQPDAEANRKFVIAAKNNLPRILAELAAKDAQIAKLNRVVEAARNMMDWFQAINKKNGWGRVEIADVVKLEDALAALDEGEGKHAV